MAVSLELTCIAFINIYILFQHKIMAMRKNQLYLSAANKLREHINTCLSNEDIKFNIIPCFGSAI